MSTSNFVGRVYYYASNWLRQIGGRQPEPHYTPIVLEYGKHNVFIVSIPWLGWWLMIAIILFGLGSVVPCRCIKK